jgi:Lrp/AsnC family transcriptional regulator, regulator for asnA, asnC and gidA
MIDSTDRDIMLALSKDGRYSYTKLAKKLHLQPMTVANRVEAMLKNDIFAIRAVPNPIKINYKVMVLIALDVEIPMWDEVCDKLANIPNISYISTMFGKYDVILFAEYRDYETLNKLVREKLPNMKGIKAIETFIISDCMKGYMKSFRTGSSSDKPFLIDEIDEQLINELRVDGRATFSALASKLGVSSATVSRRVATLVKKGVIQITVVANPTKLGHHVVAFLGLDVELNKINKISARLVSYPQITLVITLMNGYGIIAVVSHPDLNELFKFITDEIAHIDGVTNIETLIRAEFKKRTYLGFDLADMLRRSLDTKSEHDDE